MFTNLEDTEIYNDVLIEKDAHYMTRRMVEYLLFYCRVQGEEVRPLMFRESEGCAEVVWSGPPPTKFIGQPVIQVNMDGEFFDNWSIDSESIVDYLKRNGGTAQAGK